MSDGPGRSSGEESVARPVDADIQSEALTVADL